MWLTFHNKSYEPSGCEMSIMYTKSNTQKATYRKY